MKRFVCLFVCALLLISMAHPAMAQDGQVTYDGDAQEFIFSPGSDYSPTDLFPDLKSVMPGDTRTQRITVKNDASNQVKVDIYLKAYGAQPMGADFLSQLHLTVEKADDPGNYMFNAAADQPAQLGDWVKLGTLYSGGQVDLIVTLHVPTTLGNEYQDAVGKIDWAFKVEEFPIEDTDPESPETGDNADTALWLIGLMLSAAGFVTLILLYRKERKTSS